MEEKLCNIHIFHKDLDSQAIEDWREYVPEGYDEEYISNAPKEECSRCKKQIISEFMASHKDSHSSEIFPLVFLGGERNAKNKEVQPKNII